MSVADGEKKFVMKYVFKDVKKQLLEKSGVTEMSSPVEVHHGVEWKLRIQNQNKQNICYYLDVAAPHNSQNWSILLDSEIFMGGKTICANKTRNVSEKAKSFGSWIHYCHSNQYLVNGSLTLESHVKINKMTGFEWKKSRSFDDDFAKEHSDVVLKIGDEKFHVGKMYLSLHSTYFKSLFSGNFAESQKSEIELKDINAQDFQNFLELIHGDSQVKTTTVAQILKLADFFDSKTAIRRCESFLLTGSEQSLKFKLHMAIRFKMDELKKKCFSEMDKNTDFKELAPENPADFGPEIWNELYQKAVVFI